MYSYEATTKQSDLIIKHIRALTFADHQALLLSLHT